MKRRYTFTLILLALFFAAGCSIIAGSQAPPFEDIVVDEEIATEIPTSPPLVTYTPTSEPQPSETPIPTATTAPAPSASISISNIDQLEMTVLTEQETVSGIGWIASIQESVALLSRGETSGYVLTIVDPRNPAGFTKIEIPPEYHVFDLSSTGNLIACTTDYEQILLLSATTLEQQAVINPETFIANAHFSPDGTRILISSMDEMVAIEADTATGEIIKTHSGFSTAAPVYDVVYSHYTNHLIWFSRGRVQLQDLNSGVLTTDFSHEDWANAFTVSPDSQILAVATTKTLGEDYSPGIQLWRISTGEALDFLRTEHIPSALFYTPDGTLLVGTDGIHLNFWDAATGELVQELSGHIDSIYAVSMSPHGDALLTASYDGQTILWNLP